MAPHENNTDLEGTAVRHETETLLRKTIEVSFEEAFELTGHGKFNQFVLLTCGLIMLNVSMESVGMSYVITAAECELELTSEHKGLVNAAAFIGIIATSFLWGYLGDRCGRRAVMLPALVASAVFSIASSFATNVWMLLFLRMLTGCLISASSATVYAYLGEMHISSKRAAAIAWGSVFISFSFIILPGFAWVIIPGKWSFTLFGFRIIPWRAFVWSWCAPGLLAAAALLILPESPRYLLVVGGPEKALPVLATMHRWNHGAGDKFPVEKIKTSSDTSQKGGFVGAMKNFRLLFRAPLLRCVTISHLSMFAVFMLAWLDCRYIIRIAILTAAAPPNLTRQVPLLLVPLLGTELSQYWGGLELLQSSLGWTKKYIGWIPSTYKHEDFINRSSGLYVWVPDILNNMLRSTSDHQISICEIIHNKFEAARNQTLISSRCQSEVSVAVFPISMSMGAVFAITYLGIGIFIDKIGRKTLYSGIMVVCGIATIAAALIPHGIAATALLILALCAGCAASILAAIAVDVFPTSLRAMAMCTMYMVGRAGAAIGSNFLGNTLDRHCVMAFAFFGVFSAGSTILMIFWPKPEKVREEMEKKGLSY